MARGRIGKWTKYCMADPVKHGLTHTACMQRSDTIVRCVLFQCGREGRTGRHWTALFLDSRVVTCEM